jgi:predicted Holliday junction resolvase-like endonuclease
MEFLTLLAGKGINVTIDPVNLVLMVLMLATYRSVITIKEWHKPIKTDEGELFTWKHDRRREREMLAAMTAMSENIQRTTKAMEERAVEDREILQTMNTLIFRQQGATGGG